MNLLLDTHAFLWWDEGRLPKRVVARIQDAEEVFVSAATVWEIAIKSGLGKLARSRIAEAVERHGFLPLAISFAHAEATRDLPPHHSDPFDRMLIGQAREEGLALVTRDERLPAYGVPIVWG